MYNIYTLFPIKLDLFTSQNCSNVFSNYASMLFPSSNVHTNVVCK